MVAIWNNLKVRVLQIEDGQAIVRFMEGRKAGYQNVVPEKELVWPAPCVDNDVCRVTISSTYPERMIKDAKRTVSGYIPDRELYEWALDAVERRIVELEQEWFDYVKGEEAIVCWTSEMDRIYSAQQTVKAKRVYLKEVLDSLG